MLGGTVRAGIALAGLAAVTLLPMGPGPAGQESAVPKPAAQKPAGGADAAVAGRALTIKHSEFVADLADRLLGAVVNISTSKRIDVSRRIPLPEFPDGSPLRDYYRDLFERLQRGDGPKTVQSLGSGFVIDPDGIIITNDHVIGEADEITAIFRGGKKLKAEVVGRDPKTDLAVLRVKPSKPLQAVRFGDSRKMRIGNWVMAIGNPFGLGGTVTVGIVSAKERRINAGPYDSFIQTDASINRGNSGGPLFNAEGEVIGVNTAIFSETGGSVGIAFAIPSSLAQPIVAQLIEFGHARRGWLGVQIDEVSEERAKELKLGQARGAYIGEVNPAGPAARAGIKSGDVILSFNGRQIDTARSLPRIVADAAPDSKAEVVIFRDGKEMKLEVTVGLLGGKEDDENDGKEPAIKEGPQMILGMELAVITDELRERFGLADDAEGIVVVDVDPDSNAADRDVMPGDVILEVDQHRVLTPAKMAERIEELRKQGRKAVFLLLSDAAGEKDIIALQLDQ